MNFRPGKPSGPVFLTCLGVGDAEDSETANVPGRSRISFDLLSAEGLPNVCPEGIISSDYSFELRA
jgi:hypothetical protein